MANISTSFFLHLSSCGTKLEPDVQEYLESTLSDDAAFPDITSLREATEQFLLDAGMDKSSLDAFYADLIVGDSTEIKEVGVGLKKLTIEDSSKMKNQTLSSNVPSEPIVKSTASLTTPIKSKKSKGKNSSVTATTIGKTTLSNADIVATSQESRFHTETIEANTTEVDLKQVNITVGGHKDLLVDAHLRFKSGVRYGMIGRNGVGKSTLLKAIGHNILIGFPQYIRALYIEQLEEVHNNTSILETVLEADSNFFRIRSEAEALQKVLNTTSSKDMDVSPSLRVAVHTILVTRSATRLKNAHTDAARRSGARGWDARAEYLRIEEEHRVLQAQDPQTLPTDLINQIVTETLQNIADIDVEAATAKASTILRGLGFKEIDMQKTVNIFSGGWRMRIALARALFVEPEVLLLDEPTNHLDLPAILWLKNYILNETPAQQTIVVVSHDRDFLNAITEEIIVFKDGKLTYHEGNYDEYEKNQEDYRKRMLRMYEAQEKQKKHIRESISKALKQAKSSGDDKKLVTVASRKKKLERFGMNKSESGHRFKLNRDLVGYYTTVRSEIVVPKKDRSVELKIPDPEPLRYHGPVLQLSHVSFYYPGTTEYILEDISLDIEPNARIAFLGPNGCGKSTFLSLIAGTQEPTSGEVRRHHHLKIGYFTQHFVESFDLDKSALGFFMETYPGVKEQEVRGHLGSFGLYGDLAVQRMKVLSGGQRSRMGLAMVAWEKPHVLILDEVTNHLDMLTIDGLVEALIGFEGAVIFVSHDVWFMRQVVGGEYNDEEEQGEEEEEMKGQLYVVGNGNVQLWEKELMDYVDKVMVEVTS